MGKEEEDDSQLSAQSYLDKYHILTYIQDAVVQLLASRIDNPKVNAAKFLTEYFVSVQDGSHTLFREFAYVSATPHNRACFVQAFWKAFKSIGHKGDILCIDEYHALLCLLCPDLPYSLVQQTARIVLMDDAIDCLISFSDFIYAFQVQFCFEEFLKKCSEVYRGLLDKPPPGHETVVVPTSDQPSMITTPSPKPEMEPAKCPDGVDAAHFLRIIMTSCEKANIYSPHQDILREVLWSMDRVTFYGFLMALSKSARLNRVIGKLADKDKLLLLTEQDIVAPLPQVQQTPPVTPPTATVTSDTAPTKPHRQRAQRARVTVKKHRAPPATKAGADVLPTDSDTTDDCPSDDTNTGSTN